MEYELIDLQEKKKWYDYLNKLESKDIYYTPEYCEIFQRNDKGTAKLFVYQKNGYLVYYPFLIRKINDLPFLKSLQFRFSEELYDITTPYGYGGPITNAIGAKDQQEVLQGFERCFAEFCFENFIITEFVRFHPILKNHEFYSSVQKRHLRNTIFVDLTLNEAEIYQNYLSRNRNSIRKAEKSGLTVRIKPKQELDKFISVYYATMAKKAADEYYFFSEQFFKNTMNLLEDRIELVEVCYGNRMISAGLFLYYNDFVHYHFSGSAKEFLNLAPNNFMLDFMVKHAIQKGCKIFHLGGGVTNCENDSLFKFKKSFNKNGEMEFYIGTKIRNPEIYKEIISHIPTFLEDDYFPLYRSPASFDKLLNLNIG